MEIPTGCGKLSGLFTTGGRCFWEIFGKVPENGVFSNCLPGLPGEDSPFLFVCSVENWVWFVENSVDNVDNSTF